MILEPFSRPPQSGCLTAAGCSTERSSTFSQSRFSVSTSPHSTSSFLAQNRRAVRIARGPFLAKNTVTAPHTWLHQATATASGTVPAFVAAATRAAATVGVPRVPSASAASSSRRRKTLRFPLAATPSTSRGSSPQSLVARRRTQAASPAATAESTTMSISAASAEASALPVPSSAFLLEALSSAALLFLAAAGTAAVLFILFVTVGVLFQPRWIIRFVRKTIPHIVFEYVTQDKLLALTIDDGPNGETTAEILDVLKEHGCKATFFVIGSRVDKWPDLVERMHAEGHELGNHTMDDVASWRLSLDILEMSLLEVDARLNKYFRTDERGRPLKWFRPGHGWSTKPMRQLAESHGYKLALGSVFPVDPLFKKSGGPLASYCLWKIYPGAILILHDRPQQANQTVEILRRILPVLREQGYQLVTLSDMTSKAGFKEEDSEAMPLV